MSLEEKDALGLQTKYNLICPPDRLLFVDEVGSNTSQTKDGHVGGELFLCGKGERPQQRSAHKYAHFTVLGFTAANGNPIMCAIIFAAKTLEDEWVLGLDPFAEWVGDENNLLANNGKKKRYRKDQCAQLMESTYLHTVVPLKMEVSQQSYLLECLHTWTKPEFLHGTLAHHLS